MKNFVKYIAVNRVNELCFFIIGLFFISPVIVNISCHINGSNISTTDDYILIQTLVGLLSILVVSAAAIYHLFYKKTDKPLKSLLYENREIVAFSVYILFALFSTFANFSDIAWFGESNRHEGFFVFLMYVFMFVMASMLKNEKFKRRLLYILSGVSVFVGILTLLVNKEIVEYKTLLVIKDAGVFLQHNHYGYYLATTGIAMAVGALVTKKFWLKLLLYAGYIFTIYIMLMIGPLGPFLAIIAGTFFILVCYCLSKKRFVPEAFMPLFLIACVLILYTVFESSKMYNDIAGFFGDVEKVATSAEDSVNAGTTRWGLWVFTAEKIMEKPILGWGACGIMMELKLAAGSYITHNEFLQYGVFFGIPAVLAYISAALLVFLRAFKNRINLTPCETIYLSAAFVYLVSSFFGVTMYYTAPFYYLFLGLAVSKTKTSAEKENLLVVKSVLSGSPAEKTGFKKGDIVISINGNEVKDAFDFQYFLRTAREGKKIAIELKNRKRRIDKADCTGFGLEFETNQDEKQQSRGSCIFSFANQLPKGMRNTLYLKDDDARLSFLQGNYITLTNLTDEDIERIITMKLGVNVAVHTTNPALRRKILKNPKAGDSLEYLYKMAKAGIQMNCLIVVCPGINDSKELKKTLDDLTVLYPSVQSIACIPVKLTKYRDELKLPKLEAFDKSTALKTLEIIKNINDTMHKQHNNRVVYPSDELFVIAEKPIPEYDYYSDFLQLENGVGAWVCLEHDFNAALQSKKRNITTKKSIATGVMAEPLIKKLVKKLDGESVNVYAIKNNFFGEKVTDSCLVAGHDLIEQLLSHKNELGNELLIPASMLKFDENTFIDDVTLNQVEEQLGLKVTAVNCTGKALLETLLS